MPLKIAIIGAGPAGCMLARLLQHKTPPSLANSLEITIFESESTANFRSQGGSLDLHEKTGLVAVHEAGLFDEFQRFVRYDGESFKLADKDFLCYFTNKGSSTGSTSGRPEIDRPQLRELLYRALPEGTVRWGHKLTRIDADRTLHFTNGTSARGFDLVVGADGAWSRIRSFVSDEKPYYCGVSGWTCQIPNAAQADPELLALVDRGSLFSWGEAKSIMAQYMSDGSLNVATWAARPAGWRETCGYDVNDAKAVKEMFRREYASWDERLLRYTQLADDSSFVLRDLYMLPVGHAWEHREGVTLIGDAAHLMTPFAGEGVNLALEDCLKLSEQILSILPTLSKETPEIALDNAVRAFEKDMFVRATATQQMTCNMMNEMFFTPGAPRENIARYVMEAIGHDFPRTKWLLAPVVYAYFFVFKLIW